MSFEGEERQRAQNINWRLILPKRKNPLGHQTEHVGTLRELGPSWGIVTREPIWSHRNRKNIREMPKAIPLCALSCHISHTKQEQGSPERPTAGRNTTGWDPSQAGREPMPWHANTPLLRGTSSSNTRQVQHPHHTQPTERGWQSQSSNFCILSAWLTATQIRGSCSSVSPKNDSSPIFWFISTSL